MTAGDAYLMRVVKSKGSFIDCEEKKELEFNSLSTFKKRISSVKYFIILINCKKHQYKGEKLLM